jgi:hypothetical protein
MVIIVFYGVLKLKRMQAVYDAQCPPKPASDEAGANRRGIGSELTLFCLMSIATWSLLDG